MATKKAYKTYNYYNCEPEKVSNSNDITNPNLSPLDAGLTSDHEVLLESGKWIKLPNVKVGDSILTFNREIGKSFFAPVLDTLHFKYTGRLYRFKTHHLNLLCTENYWYPTHTRPARNPVIKLAHSLKLFKTIIALNHTRFPIARKGDKHLTDYERFLIALQADGWISKDRYGSGEYRIYFEGTDKAYYSVNFEFSRPDKQKRIQELLDRLNITYTLSDRPQRSGNRQPTKVWLCKIPANQLVTKDFRDWVNPTERTKEWCVEFLDEITNWDGMKTTPNARGKFRIEYYNTNIDNIEVVYTIGVLAGYTCNKYTDKRIFENQKTKHILSLNNLDVVTAIKDYINTTNANIYNLEVESGYYVVRHNYKTQLSTSYKTLPNS